jgi:glycosyltransferase involved in cell wall biosynthesis
MKLRVVFLRSNPIAPDPRVEKEARSLRRAGFSITALGWDRSGKLPEYEQVDGIQIIRRPIKAGYARGILNFFPLLLWQLDLVIWLVRQRNTYDILHACDFDTILPALLAKKLFHKRVVYDIFDFYADHLRNTPGWIKRLIRGVDLRAIEAADAVILVDDARREQIAGARPRSVTVVYNSPEELDVVETGKEELNRKTQSSQRRSLAGSNSPITAQSTPASLCLAYIGLLQVERGLLDMVAVLRRHPEWRLEMAGFGGDETQILQAAEGQDNISFHGRVPYATAIGLSRAADVLFALYDPAIPNHRYSSPNKIFEAMLLGKPVLVARGTNMDRIIEQTQAGLVVDYGDQAAIEASLEMLAGDVGLRERLGHNARMAYEQEYSWRVMEQRLEALYQAITLPHQAAG